MKRMLARLSLGAAMCVPVFLCVCDPCMRGQTPDAPVKRDETEMKFEVASIRLDNGPFRTPSFALSPDDWFKEPNGRFHADFPVLVYIQFAYKLWLTGEQEKALLANLPGWVKTDRYAIEATAPLHATKDQYRVMMKALLAERFGLKIHFEDKEIPVLAMVLTKPGKTGPKLTPHEQGPGCEKPEPSVFPPECYGFVANAKDGHTLFGSRGATMELVGRFLGSIGGSSGEIGRPIVDQTGLTGRWDFVLETAMPFGGKAAPDAPAPNGATVLEAMQEQLGIRLKPTNAVIPVAVVDHIERPSEN